MKATKIKMRSGCGSSNNLLEIYKIYLTGFNDVANNKYYTKESIHDYLVTNPGTIQVNISPFPNVIPATSPKGEKFVKSTPNSSQNDNLLSLPRE